MFRDGRTFRKVKQSFTIFQGFTIYPNVTCLSSPATLSSPAPYPAPKQKGWFKATKPKCPWNFKLIKTGPQHFKTDPDQLPTKCSVCLCSQLKRKMLFVWQCYKNCGAVDRRSIIQVSDWLQENDHLKEMLSVFQERAVIFDL